MSKILVVGKTRKLEGPDEERLWRALEVPSSMFKAPPLPAVGAPTEKPLLMDDALYMSRLIGAFTSIQAHHYPSVRSSIFSCDSWRKKSLDSVPMPEWITNNRSDYRQQGRTFVQAVAYIEKALAYPGRRLTLEDHAGEMADDILDSLVKDLIEVEASIQRRSSFANRGELVIFSEDHLKSIIAP